ncbi:zinc finger protein white collar 2 [Podospora appendiculata]|uniref:Zinc finger protein white collar 2 n=1 Tax=Podospora appendiculata TaxID=314037 RepID=A0AAE0XHP1_9PEZI|nr:zinc finger protein white collar 2 [Podospora appendiculata]
MSHGQAPPPPPPPPPGSGLGPGLGPGGASLFGFGNVGVGMGVGSVMPPPQMSDQSHDMMSGLLDGNPRFPPSSFDTMSMNLDISDAMTQSFAPTPTPTQPSIAALPGAGASDQVFSPDDSASNAMMSVGPMAVAAANPPGPSTGSTLTEFTKRRNWPAKVVEELRDFLQILDADGRIKHVSPSIEHLTGYKKEDVQELFLKNFLHPDDVGVFTSELHECIASGGQLRLFYRVRKKDGNYAIFESVGHAHVAAAKFAPNPHNQSPFCQAVFLMSRPYPTRNSGLLDSFLEHKIENERLRRRISELRKEEAEDAEESQRTWRQSQEGRSDITQSEDAATISGSTPVPFAHGSPEASMIRPERAASLNVTLTRENLEGVAGSQPDSIREKMARYEGATHTDTIEMLTGLRYLEGERSQGITTGNASPTLIKGDAGIAIPMDRDPRTGEKKKKVKVAEEYVCTDCGTLDSPEWRKGPSGPKTLCNACGLRWAKKEKKRNNTGVGSGQENQADNLG